MRLPDNHVDSDALCEGYYYLAKQAKTAFRCRHSKSREIREHMVKMARSLIAHSRELERAYRVSAHVERGGDARAFATFEDVREWKRKYKTFAK